MLTFCFLMQICIQNYVTMNFFQNKFKHAAVPKEINLSAGAELLSRFQEDWQSVHHNSVLSSTEAKVVSRQLEKSFAVWKQTNEKFTRLHVQLQTLPGLVEEVDRLSVMIGQIESSIEEVSCSLDLYEKVCDEYERCKRRQIALQEVNELRISKRQELEKMKEALAKNHAEKLSVVQARQTQVANEREASLLKALNSVTL